MSADFIKFSVPAEIPVFYISLLNQPHALALARLAVDELRERFPDSTPSNVKSVYMSPWKSHLETEKLKPLIDIIQDHIYASFREHLGADLKGLNFELSVADCWCAIYDSSDFTQPHNHIPSDVSAVVYLEMDENSAPIVFNNAVAVNPVPGSLVVFPGNLIHHVPATQGKRVIIAANFIKLPNFIAPYLKNSA
jgi:hypothetical protein